MDIIRKTLTNLLENSDMVEEFMKDKERPQMLTNDYLPQLRKQISMNWVMGSEDLALFLENKYKNIKNI